MPTSTESPATAEHARLAEATGRAEDDLFSANPWYEWGPYLSERAWGTVREDYSESGDAWDSFPARPRPLTRVSVERGRDGRHLRHPSRALPGARALERPGSDPEGADVRPHGAAGQPRRGRQGVLVVPRGAAEPRAPALALPLPAGAVSLRRAREPRPRARRTRSSSCSTPVRSTTIATGRWTSPTRRPSRPRSSPASRSRTTGRTRRPSKCCRRSGSGTRGRGARAPRAPASSATGRLSR